MITPPSEPTRQAQASVECRGNVAGGSTKPAYCSRCRKAKLPNGRPLAIHWSHRCAAWLCLWCHFEAPEAQLHIGGRDH